MEVKKEVKMEVKMEVKVDDFNSKNMIKKDA